MGSSTLRKTKDLLFPSWKEGLFLGGSNMHVIFLMWKMKCRLASQWAAHHLYLTLRAVVWHWGLVGHHGGHTLVWVRLLLHLYFQTQNWKSCQSSCLRSSVDLLALWNHHQQQVSHCQCLARHFCPCVKQESYGEGFWLLQPSAALCYVVPVLWAPASPESSQKKGVLAS